MKVSIIDLDNTLVNTEILKRYRDTRNWEKVFDNIKLTTITEKTNELLKEAQDGKIIIVTSSPNTYARKVLNYHNISYDNLIGYHDVENRKPSPDAYLLAIEPYLEIISHIVIYGDEEKDFIAADYLEEILKDLNKKIARNSSYL